MAIFAYSVQIDGHPCRGEVEAPDDRVARAALLRNFGPSVVIRLLFRPPPRLGTPRPIQTMPTAEMRASALRGNWHRDLYDTRFRSDHARDRAVRR